MNSTDNPLVTSVCYVRLAIAELQARRKIRIGYFRIATRCGA